MTDPGEFTTMTCEEFQSLLPEMIGTGKDVDRHPHLRNCGLCKALVDDLKLIAELIAKEARNRRIGQFGDGEDWS
jgi:hypothetical protein